MIFFLKSNLIYMNWGKGCDSGQNGTKICFVIHMKSLSTFAETVSNTPFSLGIAPNFHGPLITHSV